jgi:transporter family-2 protein
VATVQTRQPRGIHALVGTPARAIAAAVVAGIGVSVQFYINGRLGREVGSATVAAAVNNLVAVVAALACVVGARALPRAVGRVRALGRPPLWQFTGGVFGASIVLVSAAAAPRVGVALLTVAVVCGTTAGSLVVDAIGIGPAGRRPITGARVAGVALAVSATVAGALGVKGDLEPVLLVLALAAGAGIAVQSAANGRLAAATGEPFVTALVNSSLGLVVVCVVAAVAVLVGSVGALPGNPLLYIGGVFGAIAVVVTATGVATIGILRLGLAMVAGQAIGALAVDLVAPVPGEVVTVGTVAGVLLTLAAVAISGRGRQTQGA